MRKIEIHDSSAMDENMISTIAGGALVRAVP